MPDEITQKHLDTMRVRGAPATIPGAGRLVGTYDCVEVRRQAMRTLVIDLGNDYDLPELRAASEKLAQTAAGQGLRVLEAPLLTLNGNPTEDVPHEWQWELALPVRGPAKAADGITVGRLHGGIYLETNTTKGFPDLGSLYTFFVGQFMPARKQQLTRGCIYHRITDGLDGTDVKKVSLTVFLPMQLSLGRPIQVVTRETM